MINNGVPLHIIQRFLGHESPDMTATYADIGWPNAEKEMELSDYFDENTFHQKIRLKYRRRTVNISGQVLSAENPELETSELQLFKRNVHAQALPNRSGARPIIKGACPDEERLSNLWRLSHNSWVPRPA